jgi:hypothetical protein
MRSVAFTTEPWVIRQILRYQPDTSELLASRRPDLGTFRASFTRPFDAPIPPIRP